MTSMYQQLLPESPDLYLDDLLLGERTRLQNDLRLAAYMICATDRVKPKKREAGRGPACTGDLLITHRDPKKNQ
jgi:hypothetical protein